MVRIPLTKGLFAIVDDKDASLALLEWSALVNPRSRTAYAVRFGPRDSEGKRETFYLHRVVAKVGPGVEVDHRNGDGLDCRRGNLRRATHAQNQRNQRARGEWKGVSRHESRWRARITVDGAETYLGRFESAEAAARAYDAAARRLHGRFAELNFPRNGERGARSLAP